MEEERQDGRIALRPRLPELRYLTSRGVVSAVRRVTPYAPHSARETAKPRSGNGRRPGIEFVLAAPA
jgi:hypothetical protein